MKHQRLTPAPEETLDGCYLCHGCDRPRTGVLAYCPDCEEVTQSYLFDAPAPGSVTGYALVRLEAETLESMSRVNLPSRLDTLAAKRVGL